MKWQANELPTVVKVVPTLTGPSCPSGDGMPAPASFVQLLRRRAVFCTLTSLAHKSCPDQVCAEHLALTPPILPQEHRRLLRNRRMLMQVICTMDVIHKRQVLGKVATSFQRNTGAFIPP